MSALIVTPVGALIAASCFPVDPLLLFLIPAATALWRVTDGAALAARTLILRAAHVDEPTALRGGTARGG